MKLSLLLLASDAFSQPVDVASPYRFLNIGKAQGFEGKPTCVFQDSYGFVWIGGEAGLFRFNGYSCVSYSDSLPSNFIAYHAFHEDRDRNLWIATYDAGFAKFDRKTERFQHFRESAGRLREDRINALTGDGKDGIWIVARNKGLNHYFPKRDTFIHYWSDSLAKIGALFDLSLGQSGQLWLGAEKGVAVLDSSAHTRCFFPGKPEKSGLSGIFVSDVFEDDSRRMWAVSRTGLTLLNASGPFVHYRPENDPTLPKDNRDFNIVQRVFQTRDGDFWLGTDGGLLRFDPTKPAYESIEHDPARPTSIAKGGIHGIMEDDGDGLWFAANQGLSLLNRKAALLYDRSWSPAQAAMPSVNDLFEHVSLAEAGNRIWISRNGGLFTFRAGETNVRQLDVGKANITALFLNSRGLLYAGGDGEHIFVIDPKSERVIRKEEKGTDGLHYRHKATGGKIMAFEEDQRGRCWIGTQNGLNLYDPDRKEYRQFYHDPNDPSSLSNSDINDLHLDKQGNLWIATMGGLNVLWARVLERPLPTSSLPFAHLAYQPHNSNSISNDHIRAICEDPQGGLWLGTDAGLNLYAPKQGRWERFFKENGLPDNKITGLVTDAEGNIWITTLNHGIAKYVATAKRFFSLGIPDGMNSEQFPSGACLKMSDGRLVFVGTGGLNVFDPQVVGLRYDTFPLYFVEIRLFNQPVKPGGPDGLLQQAAYLTHKIEIGYAQNVLSFQVAALNFTSPEKQVYRYRLEGFAALESWQYLGTDREITLTNLFPGDYTLYVESTAKPDDRAHWESSARMVIRVRYPWGTILLYAAAILATLYLVYKLRLRRKLASAEARRLLELDSVKTKLYTNITHEFRTPLTVILGETSQLEKQAGENQRGGLSSIQRQGRHLLHLVNEMLDLSKVEAGAMRLHWAQGDVVLFLKYLLESFHSLADGKQIELRFEADADEFWMDYDADKLQKIISNLLSNALKFVPKGGRVSLRVATNEVADGLVLLVSDNGPGIPPEKLPLIFDHYYQADDSPGGTGIGLTLTKELVHLLGGQINAKSRLGEGTTFTVTLPVTHKADKRHFDVEEFLGENQGFAAEPEVPAAIIPTPQQSQLPQLLLIEDNTDVARYIGSLLAADYNIHSAANGKEGLEAAFRLVPDLVISDVMMPEMDGFALCRALKTDVRTSHIPVVLLTAKADLDSRIEGLEHGADAYLAKPFEERELRVQLRKLHELRQALRERYAAFAPLAPTDNPAFEREYPFFQKLYAALEQRFSDEKFDVPKLCEAMGMNHTNLFRKLTALTGKNIEDYLRSFRLSKAREMLRSTDKLVSEVGWDCGFKDPAHFTKAFRKEFGIPPSEARA